VTNGERLRAASVAAGLAAALVLSPAPSAFGGAATSLTLRHSAQGWVDLVQAGAAVLACPDGGLPCLDRSDPGVATTWVDIDGDPSTVNSSRAELAMPPGAAVNWAGLYWGGDRGQRTDGTPRCEPAPDSAGPATPATGEASQVSVAIGDSGYTAVAAAALTDVSGGGGAAFQAYADVTSLLGSATGSAAGSAGSSEPSAVPVTVANVQVARGPGCVGGWTVVVAYSYPNGPDPAYAPAYRSIAIYDGAVGLVAGTAAELSLDGLATGTRDARLTTALLSGGRSLDLTIGGAAVPRSGEGVSGVSGVPGPGYHLATSPVARQAVAGSTATAAVTTGQNSYLGAVLGLSRVLPVTVDLSVATSLTPTTLAVGADTTLTVSVRNDSDVRATGVAVTLRLPGGLTLTAGRPGYDAGTGVWAVGSVPAGGSVDLTLPLRVLSPGNLITAAEISASHLPDPDSSPGDGAAGQDDFAEVAVTVPTAPPSASNEPAQAVLSAPSRTPWSRYAPAALFGVGLVALGLLLLLIVVVRGRTAR
jgi:uncharacterized repeat protein (TIGR01451 family)